MLPVPSPKHCSKYRFNIYERIIHNIPNDKFHHFIMIFIIKSLLYKARIARFSDNNDVKRHTIFVHYFPNSFHCNIYLTQINFNNVYNNIVCVECLI